MTAQAIGTGLATALALYVIGMTAWIFTAYLRRLAATQRSREARSGLLPLHVLAVSSWSIGILARSIARDQFDGPPPLWLDWPSTLLFAAWLAAALLLLRKHYRRTGVSLRELNTE